MRQRLAGRHAEQFRANRAAKQAAKAIDRAARRLTDKHGELIEPVAVIAWQQGRVQGATDLISAHGGQGTTVPFVAVPLTYSQVHVPVEAKCTSSIASRSIGEATLPRK